MDTHTRSILKATSYRLLATIGTATIVFVLTGSFTFSLGVGIADMALKIILYYFHERLWNKSGWGKN